MKHYAVMSPVYEDGGINEPPETTCDYVEVDAPNKRSAKVAGLREMRRKFPYGYWSGSYPGSPFAGLKAIEICEHGIPIEDATAGFCEECGGPGPCAGMVNDYDPCHLLAGHDDPHWRDAR